MIEAVKSWVSKGGSLRTKIKRVQEGLDNGSIKIEVDEERINLENLEQLTEVELYALREKYPAPMKEVAILGTVSVGYFSFCTWLMINYGPQFIKKIVPAHRRNFGSIVVKGTMMAGTACSIYGIAAYGII